MNKKAAPSLYDKPFKTRAEINVSTFALMFSEMINYLALKDGSKVEENLEKLGYSIGPRILEYVTAREKATKRDIKILDIIKVIHGPVWKTLFSKTADNIEKLSADSYVLYDYNPIYLKYVPEPDGAGKTYARYVGGIIHGILEYSDFPCSVETQTPPNDGKSLYPKTAFVITFTEKVLKREATIK